MEYKSFYKTVGGNEGSLCRYNTRLDTYGRGCAVSEEVLHAYLLKYAEWINRYHIKQFFELDVDKIVGYSRVLDYRKELQDLTGEPSIPVWHKTRGAEEFLRTCEEFPYVAVGGIAAKDIKRSEYPAFGKMIKEAHKRGAKIHGLGFTAVTELGKYHFDSVDSSAWTTGNRFGYIDIFHNGAMIRKKPPRGHRLKVEEAAKNNFCEWVKFQRYAENKL